MQVPVPGEGEAAEGGGPAGDLYCVVNVQEHPLFQREGPHLVCQVPIGYAQAALGSAIEVPTLDGKTELKVPAGTQSGDVFKLRGKGIFDYRARGVGDLVVQVHIEVPKALTPRQEELLRELAEIEHTHVSPRRKTFFEKLKECFSPEPHERKEA
jgi:molecular chaperone DnaJ